MLLRKHLQVLGRHGILMLDHANGLGRVRLEDLGSVRMALGGGLVVSTVLVGSRRASAQALVVHVRLVAVDLVR